MLSKSPTLEINGSFGLPEKEISINFTKANTNLFLSLHYNTDNSYLFVNWKEMSKFKADNKNVNFSAQSCLGSVSNAFSNTESREVSSSGYVYDFSVYHISIGKFDN